MKTLLALAAYVVFAALACADPVPDRPVIEVVGSTRGTSELRDPSLTTADLSFLLRSCIRCHGSKGPSKPLFNARRQLLPGLQTDDHAGGLLWAVKIALRVREEDGTLKYMREEDRSSLLKVWRLLVRQ